MLASDTWAAHSYVEGVGSLDQCNGRTDADGNYAYYTTDNFPYILGCFQGGGLTLTPRAAASVSSTPIGHDQWLTDLGATFS